LRRSSQRWPERAVDLHRSTVSAAGSDRPLAIPAFRWFLAGRLVSLLGSGMAPVALALGVLQESGRPGDLGVVLASHVVPQLALLLVGGAVADRLSRRTVLVAANLGAGLTQGAVAAVLITGHYSLPVVAGLELMNGALEAFTSPALRGILPDLVPAAGLGRANALLASSRNATKILGPTAAGLLVLGAGGGWAIAVDAVSFLVAAGCLTRLRLPPRPVTLARARVVTDIWAGWQAFRGIAWLWRVSASFCAVNLVGVGTWQVLGPTLTSQRSGAAAWGLVLSARSVGLLAISAVLYRVVFRHPLRAGQLAGVLGAAPLLALALALGLGLGAELPLLLASALIAGLGLAVAGITWDTAMQQNTPRDVLSRVASFDDLLSYGAIPVGQLLVGPAAAHWGGPTVILWSGIAYAASVLVPLTARAVRDLPAVPPAGKLTTGDE